MNEQPDKEQKLSSKAPKGKLRENIEALVIAVILAVFIRTFGVQAFKIPTGSMKNTLLVGDYILVNKFIYGVKIPFTDKTLIPVKDPKRGEIIVFKFPKDTSKDYIKRVVGIGGDTVEIRAKKVYINGKLQIEDYTIFADSQVIPVTLKCREDAINVGQNIGCRDNLAPFKVPEDKLFVMGDNRDQSNDSRFWKFVNVSAVKGRAFMVYWSWDKDKPFGVRWKRLGNLIR